MSYRKTGVPPHKGLFGNRNANNYARSSSTSRAKTYSEIREDRMTELREELRALNDDLQLVISINEKEKTNQNNVIRGVKETCHSLAFTLCEIEGYGRVLENEKLEHYIPSAILDVNVDELEKEAAECKLCLEETKKIIKNFPREHICNTNCHRFYIMLRSGIFLDIKYDKFKLFFSVEELEKTIYGGLAEFKKMLHDYDSDADIVSDFEPAETPNESDKPVNPPKPVYLYPRLPRVKGFKPFLPKAAKKQQK